MAALLAASAAGQVCWDERRDAAAVFALEKPLTAARGAAGLAAAGGAGYDLDYTHVACGDGTAAGFVAPQSQVVRGARPFGTHVVRISAFNIFRGEPWRGGWQRW